MHEDWKRELSDADRGDFSPAEEALMCYLLDVSIHRGRRLLSLRGRCYGPTLSRCRVGPSFIYDRAWSVNDFSD